jgi:precorrin-6B C5,15-methyltransferase / cobalt-precorrin-6B C5,C15-methyltransferase
VPEVDARAVTVVGIADDRLELLAPEAKAALRRARTVIGGQRHLALYRAWRDADVPAVDTLPITAHTEELMARVRALVSGGEGPLCVLASGDPGFFGILRTLLSHLDRHQLEVLPAASSVSVAFARLGLPWDDAVVVSAHGRPLNDAVRVARTAPKVAVLTSPDSPPEALGKALLAAGCVVDTVAVCSRLGSSDEEVRELSLDELALGRFDPLSVVALIGPGALPLTGWSASGNLERTERHDRVLAWGRDDATYAHRGGMITKAETRAIALGKLSLPEQGVLWDVGAGSGSIAIEAALLCPGLTVFAVDASEEDAERISTNAAAAGVGVHVISGAAPGSLAGLPDPDRAFVGGGGIDVLESVLGRLTPGGHVVATFAALDRAVEAAHLLGHLIEVRADRGERLPDGSWRLAANNPVFLSWGPSDEPAAAS